MKNTIVSNSINAKDEFRTSQSSATFGNKPEVSCNVQVLDQAGAEFNYVASHERNWPQAVEPFGTLSQKFTGFVHHVGSVLPCAVAS